MDTFLFLCGFMAAMSFLAAILIDVYVRNNPRRRKKP